MPSKYRQLKEAVGLAQRRPDPNLHDDKKDSVAGKLARLKEELKTTLAPQVEAVANKADRKALHELHKEATQLVKDENLIDAEVVVRELKSQLKIPNEVPKTPEKRGHDDLPMLTAMEGLKFDATNLEGWSLKVTRCEAFLKNFARYKPECVAVEDMLAEAIKQETLLKVAGKYTKAVKGEELDLAPKERERVLKGMPALMGKEPLDKTGLLDEEILAIEKGIKLVKETGLVEDEVVAIRMFTAMDYKYINPAVANQKDQADDNMLNLKNAKTTEEKRAMESDIETYKAKGWLDAQGRLVYTKPVDPVRDAEFKLAAQLANLKTDQEKGDKAADIQRMKDKGWLDAQGKLNYAKVSKDDKDRAEFDEALKKYKKQEFMDTQMEKGLGKPRKISELTDETDRKAEQAVFDKQYEDAKKDFYEKGSVHGAMLAQALKKLPAKKGKVYRGARMTEAQFQSTYKKGQEFHLENFQSNSTKEAIATGFATGDTVDGQFTPDQTVHVMAIIDVVDGRDVCSLSVEKKEDEWVLLPETRLMVTKIENLSTGPEGRRSCKATSWKTVHIEQV